MHNHLILLTLGEKPDHLLKLTFVSVPGALWDMGETKLEDNIDFFFFYLITVTMHTCLLNNNLSINACTKNL